MKKFLSVILALALCLFCIAPVVLHTAEAIPLTDDDETPAGNLPPHVGEREDACTIDYRGAWRNFEVDSNLITDGQNSGDALHMFLYQDYSLSDNVEDGVTDLYLTADTEIWLNGYDITSGGRTFVINTCSPDSSETYNLTICDCGIGQDRSARGAGTIEASFKVVGGGSLTICGGNFTAQNSDSVVYATGADAVVHINGGTFTHPQDEAALIAADQATIEINGYAFTSGTGSGNYIRFNQSDAGDSTLSVTTPTGDTPVPVGMTCGVAVFEYDGLSGTFIKPVNPSTEAEIDPLTGKKYTFTVDGKTYMRADGVVYVGLDGADMPGGSQEIGDLSGGDSEDGGLSGGVLPTPGGPVAPSDDPIVFDPSSDDTVDAVLDENNRTVSGNIFGTYWDSEEAQTKYYVDVIWGNFQFTYYATESQNWDPTKHTVEGVAEGDWRPYAEEDASITVVNHSNIEVTASLEVNKNNAIEGELNATFTKQFTRHATVDEENASITLQDAMEVSGVRIDGMEPEQIAVESAKALANAPTATVLMALEGGVMSADYADAEEPVAIGTVTVTLQESADSGE